MKKIINIILILMCILLLPNHVIAYECNNEERQKNYNLINNINITYTHKGNNIFDIKIYNIPEQIYLIDSTNKKHYYSSNNEVSISSNVPGGQTYRFKILSTNNDNCIDSMNYTKSIYIKKYNVYSEKEICKDQNYSDFKYCNQWYQGTITDEKFNSELKKYEISQSQVEKLENSEEKNIFNNIYVLISIGSGILFLIILIFIIVKKKKRRIKL